MIDIPLPAPMTHNKLRTEAARLEIKAHAFGNAIKEHAATSTDEGAPATAETVDILLKAALFAESLRNYEPETVDAARQRWLAWNEAYEGIRGLLRVAEPQFD